jgi:alpha-glucosidase
MKMNKCLNVFLMALALNVGSSFSAENEKSIKLKGPDGTVTAKIFIDNSRLCYTLSRIQSTIIEKSDLGIVIDGVDLGTNVALGESKFGAIEEKYAWYGVKSEAINRCNTVAIPIKSGGLNWTLEARAYDDGFAYRYVVPGEGKRTVKGEKTNWRLPAGCQIWYQVNTVQYEGVFRKGKPTNIVRPLGFPVTIELSDGTFAAITEGAVFDYSGMTLKTTEENTLHGIFEDDPNGFAPEGEIRSPWRITITGPDLNALVNCDIIHNVCEPPDDKLFPQGVKTEWIKPGRALWHWWSGKIGDFNGVTLEKQKWWADKAAEMGMEYILVDAGWELMFGKDGRDKWATLRELCDYAGKKNVRIWVWKRWAAGRMEGAAAIGLDKPGARRDFFEQCRKAGVAGVKIDFLDSESKDRIDFYTNTLKDAAEYKLMINFHGANKPTGESRTFPNEMTREGVRGLEHNKWDVLPPDHYAILPFTRFLAGHGDFTPCTLDANMLKGTTVTLQLASAVLYTSPVMHWADRPDLYLDSPAIEVIKQIPSTWDQTVVLSGSKIGALAALARRKGDSWFVGVINGSKEKRNYALDLSFLGDGRYKATLVRDQMDKPAAMTIEQTSAEKMGKIAVEMAPGGGFVAYLKK